MQASQWNSGTGVRTGEAVRVDVAEPSERQYGSWPKV